MKTSLMIVAMLALLLSACKKYPLTIQPPDCTISNSQQECQTHGTTVINDEEDSNPELEMK